MDDEVLDTEGLADLLGLTPKTLKRYRSRNEGPPFIRLGHTRVRYLRSSVLAWLASKETTSG